MSGYTCQYEIRILTTCSFVNLCYCDYYSHFAPRFLKLGFEASISSFEDDFYCSHFAPRLLKLGFEASVSSFEDDFYHQFLMSFTPNLLG